MTRDRRGFTLVELVIVSVLGTVVAGTALQVLIVNQRTFTAQAATIAGQQSTRMVLDVLFSELREVSAGGGDIIAMGPDSIRVRLMRKWGFVCETDFTGQPELTVIPWGVGTNSFEVSDSVFAFADNDPDQLSDDVWISARVTNVTATTCPQAAEPAQILRFGAQGGLFAADSVGLGAPVRSYREFTFGTTVLAGDTYLGRREGSGDMIPVAGPLRAANALDIVYRDADGVVTATATDVRQLEILVRTGTGVLNGLGDQVSDSITAWIHTRN